MAENGERTMMKTTNIHNVPQCGLTAFVRGVNATGDCFATFDFGTFDDHTQVFLTVHQVATLHEQTTAAVEAFRRVGDLPADGPTEMPAVNAEA